MKNNLNEIREVTWNTTRCTTIYDPMQYCLWDDMGKRIQNKLVPLNNYYNKMILYQMLIDFGEKLDD